MTTRSIRNVLAVVSTTEQGVMSAADKVKLDGIEPNATANQTDAYLLNRENHDGTQPAASISDLPETVQDLIGAALVAGANVTITYDDIAGTITIAATQPDALLFPNRGLASARPAAGNRGDTYYETDTYTLWADNGTAWEFVAIAGLPFEQLTDVPLYSGHGGKILRVLTTEDGIEYIDNVPAPSALDDLTDVDAPSPDPDDVLTWDGTAWVNLPAASSTLAINDLTDVDTTGLAASDILQWNGTAWVPVDMPSGGSGMANPMTTADDMIYTAAGNVNVALASAGATFSSNGGYYSSAGGEADGNDASYGFSNTSAAAGSWFQQNLGSAKTIGSWRFVQNRNDDQAYRATAIKLQSSTDGSTWTDRDTVSGIPSGSYDTGPRSITAVTAQYWRVLATAGGAYGWCVNTIEIRTATSPARLPKGANNTVLGINAAGVFGYKPDPSYPRQAHLWMDGVLPVGGTSALTLSFDTGQRYNMSSFQSGVPANGDAYDQDFFLAAGTYTLYALGIEANNRAILDYQIDGVSVLTGQDWYNATATKNVTKSGSVTVTTNGRHTLRVIANGKHASSTDYYLGLTKIWIK